MSSAAEINQALETAQTAETEAVGEAARTGLGARPYTLPAWLFYDRRGSELFEQITELPEYYLTRTERALFERCAAEMLQCAAGERELAFLELGAGTATKTGVLLRAAVERQGHALYVPVDVSASALEEAERSLTTSIPGLSVEPQVANYFTGPINFRRPGDACMLALYIGSSIGNFDPEEARGLLRHLHAQLRPGDALLLGTDLAPAASERQGTTGSQLEGKSVEMLLAAYDDAAGVTAAFNLNVLGRLRRELSARLDLSAFRHEARWNRVESRIEMHLRAMRPTSIVLPNGVTGETVRAEFRSGETIHTENSYKYTSDALHDLLDAGGFRAEQVWSDERGLFAVTLARVQ